MTQRLDHTCKGDAGQKGTEHHINQHDVRETERHIEQHLKKNPHDFKHVFDEIDHLRKQHPHEFKKDLSQINDDLHKKGILPHLQLIEDSRVGAGNHVQRGYAVVSDDKQNSKGNHTEVSTSHGAHESKKLRDEYRSMHYKHGHYNGFNQSVEGGGGAHGGFDKHAVGGHVPEGARKELIDKALKLAGLQATPQNEAALNKIVTRESGWNPNITNNWDSNARAGHPSTGLMQTIPGTFQKWALSGLNNNIHDPLSNLVAGLRYIQGRYGHDGLTKIAGRPGGY